MNNALKIAYFGLNISIKLNEMLIRAFMVFFRPHEPLEVSPYEITFGRWPRRGKRERSLFFQYRRVCRSRSDKKETLIKMRRQINLSC